jgi:hypothetical protein
MWKRRRQLLWAGLLVALAGLGLAWISVQHSPDEERKFAQIRAGIPDAEAARILRQDFGIDIDSFNGARGWTYGCLDYEISLQMQNRIVTKASFVRRQSSFIERLRRLLGN